MSGVLGYTRFVLAATLPVRPTHRGCYPGLYRMQTVVQSSTFLCRPHLQMQVYCRAASSCSANSSGLSASILLQHALCVFITALLKH